MMMMMMHFIRIRVQVRDLRSESMGPVQVCNPTFEEHEGADHLGNSHCNPKTYCIG
jgi:hypothetical protein